jgi:hypothetical protein
MKRLTTSFLIISLIIISSLGVSGQTVSGSHDPETIFETGQDQYFRFKSPGKEITNDLSEIISIDKAGSDGYIYAYSTPARFGRFLEYGIDFEILPHPGRSAKGIVMKSEIDIREVQEWNYYPTYEAYISMMNQFAQLYPSLCQVSSIGTTIQGRQLMIAKISDNVGLNENEPRFLYTSTIHGDETTGYILMLRLIDYLLSNYGTDPRITSMVNGIEIWINPNANPDGTYWQGNDTVAGAMRYNANWVDLNRNFPDPVDGLHPDGEDWQPETLVFMALAEEKAFNMSANIHGGTEVCNYPWDTWEHLHADDDWWQYVCHQYADTAQFYSPPGYMNEYDDGITNGYAWYRITGGRQDFTTYFHNGREFTLEISDEKLLPASQLPALWNYNYRSLLNYMEQSMFGLRGVVRDSITGWPMVAEVQAVFHEQDSSWTYSRLPVGNYHRYLHEGTYTIRFSAPGYVSRIISGVTVTNGQATVLDVKLWPEGGVGGIDNHDLLSRQISVYPNPATNGMVHFEAPFEILDVEVIDLAGRVSRSASTDLVSSRISLGPAKDGLYILKFVTENGNGYKKITLNRGY